MKWLLATVVLAACGSDPPPPPRGTATAHVYDFAGQPVAGATVMFQDRLFTDGTFATTDAMGAATAEVDAGWYVTRVDTGLFSTFTNVGPGDDLVFGTAAPPPPSDPPPTLTVQFPPDPDAPDDFYTLYTTCGVLASGDAAMGATTQLAAPCTGPIDVFFVGGARTAVAIGVPIVDGVATIAALTYGPRPPPTDFALANVSDANNMATYPFGVGRDIGFPYGSAFFSAGVPLPFDIDIAPAPIRTLVDVFTAHGEVRAWSVAPIMLDVGALALPTIVSAKIDDDTPAITWQAMTGTALPDIAVATITNSPHNRAWQIEGPWRGTGMQLPVLPLQLGAGSLDSNDHVTQVQLMRAASVAGPDGWRALPFGSDAVLSREVMVPETDGDDAEAFYQF